LRGRGLDCERVKEKERDRKRETERTSERRRRRRESYVTYNTVTPRQERKEWIIVRTRGY